MKYTDNRPKLVTCIIICSTIQSGGGYAIKYHNVIYSDEKLARLERYLEKKGIAWTHINLYDKVSRRFVEQIKKK